MSYRTPLALSLLALLPGAALGQSFTFQVDAPQSTVDIDSSVELALPGTVIGDYDAVTNPTGTRTLPGLFGGSGNQPVDMDITFLTALAAQGQPSGSFGAQVDLNLATIEVTGFALDALGGQAAQADLTLELLYQTFRTFDPNSLFLGGIALPLPLGQATVSGLAFAQNGPAFGLLVPDPLLPNTYTTTVLLPADVSFTIDLLGQVTPVGPLPLVLPLDAVLFVDGGTALLTIAAQQQTSQTIPDPLPGQTIDDFPLPVPTILPPGATANLLFNAVFGELVFDLATSLTIVADGTALCTVDRLCAPSRNSAGTGAVIDAVGSVSVGANSLSIQVTALPPFKATNVLFSSQSAAVPFGSGTLCLAGTVYRLTPVQSNAFGVADFPVDFTLPSPKFQALTPGSVWYFQCLYRDPVWAGPPGNTSEALRIQLCP